MSTVDLKTMDEMQQKAEWRARLIADVLSNMHDEDTRAEMLEAGLHQAHSEGVLDAAEICEAIERAAESPSSRRAAGIIAKALRAYDARNKATQSPHGQPAPDLTKPG